MLHTADREFCAGASGDTQGGEESFAAYHGGMDSYAVAVIWSLLPTLVVSAIFYFVLRSILRADRTERRVYAKVEAEERAKRGLPPVEPAASER